MRTEIFNNNQLELLPTIRDFKRSFFLVGGTAIALHIGHRRSIDFDLFTNTNLIKSRLKAKIQKLPFRQIPLFEDFDQLHLLINNVKVTFFSFPFIIPHPVKMDTIITLPTLLSLAAMKAYALGRRSKWKDYVDLFFILSRYYTIDEVVKEALNNF